MSKYEWLEKKTPRAVDQLRLWPDNPRLNPVEQHIRISDYAEDFTSDDAEKRHFFKLIRSIADDGFIPADPVIVWQDKDNNKYYVAEGNRRVLALKLLKNPEKAPKSIRGYVREQSKKIVSETIDKILVNVAPTFEDAEWYINQRNSSSSLQRRWERSQQQKWITDLYHKYNGDIEHIVSITKMSKGELEGFVRITKILDFTKNDEVKNFLTDEEYEVGSHFRFPVTILERFFFTSVVSEKWGIKYDGFDVIITSNKSSFFKAFAALISGILDKTRKISINTRTITSNFEEILESLPDVFFDTENKDEDSDSQSEESEDNSIDTEQEEDNGFKDNEISCKIKTKHSYKNDPNRPRLIVNEYRVNTDNYRIRSLFNELKTVPLKYNNSIAASIRIFLDLTVYNYLKLENLTNDIEKAKGTGIANITLNKRLDFLKQGKNLKDESNKLIDKLLNNNNEYSLDVLNGFIHSEKTHYLQPRFLNGFWDFLFPLFEELLDISEAK